MLYRPMRGVFSALVNLLSKSKIEGRENFPESGAFLIVANHMSMVDIPLASTFIGDPNIKGWIAAKWSGHPLLAPIARIVGGTFIQRGEVDRAALREAIDWLNSGKPFALAPEGTRSKHGALLRGKTGAAYLAAEADVPVVPAAFIGTDEAFRKLFLRLRRPELTLRIGKPFRLPPLDRDNRPESLRKNTDEIMCRIAAVLPPRHWGYYAEHPRLQELLEQERGSSPEVEDAGTLGN
ncbi:MAG: lysophospholipid acyltransferase family protein [Anaerolineales bacterium]